MKILFVCTHNRCRSIIAEAVMQKLVTESELQDNLRGKFEIRSAGSAPSGVVHPLSLKYLQELGFPTEHLRSQSWQDFEDFAPDIVITVCDSAANESCPVWLGSAERVHWGVADPSKLSGSDDEKRDAFVHTIKTFENRIQRFLKEYESHLSVADAKQALQSLAE